MLLVVFVAPFANPNPDGLEKVAADSGHRRRGAPSTHLADSPFADYGVDGVDNAVLGDRPRRPRRHRGHVRRRRRRRLDRPPAARPPGAAGGPRRLSTLSGRRATGTSLVHAAGPLHRIAPQCKLLATVLFVFAVVATPKEQFWAFGVARRPRRRSPR